MQMNIAELKEIQDECLPLSVEFGFLVEDMNDGMCIVRAPYSDIFLRPGGTVAGPIIMALADFAMYVAILSQDATAVQAVTSSLNINFLRRAAPGDLVAVANLMRFGKRLAVGTVEVSSDSESALVAHVTCTYSIPQQVYGK